MYSWIQELEIKLQLRCFKHLFFSMVIINFFFLNFKFRIPKKTVFKTRNFCLSTINESDNFQVKNFPLYK